MKPFPMNNAVEILWQMVPEFLLPGDTAVDATVGNGRDTEALCRIVGPSGKVYGFDIQTEALERARSLLEEAVPETPCILIHESHSALKNHIAHPVDLVLFNLGYLPGGDKRVTTKADTTLEAMTAALELLKTGGKLAAVLYPGHEAGAEEATAVIEWSSTLNQKKFTSLLLTITNQINHPPQLLLIEKRG